MSEKELLQKLVNQVNRTYIAIGYEKITIDGTAKTLTLPTDAIYAEFRYEGTTSARYRIDGTAPTTTDGMLISNLDVFDILNRENLSRFKAIHTAAGTDVLHITYYK
jgi:hypothetical protein